MVGGGRTGISRGLKIILTLGGLFGVLLLAAGLAYWRFGRDSGPLRGTSQQPAPALVSEPDAGRGSVDVIDVAGRVPGPEIDVAVEAPPGAAEMQIGLDPTFTSTPWLPASSTVTVSTSHVGHQMVFGRFRGEGLELTEVSVDGVDVDPTYDQATSSQAGTHQASWVRPLAAGSVMVRIEAGRLGRGAQEAYDFDNPPPGDDVSGFLGLPTVKRDGEPYGIQVDGSEHLLRPYDQLVGRPIEASLLDETSWLVTSADGAQVLSPSTVQRVSRPAGAGLGPAAKRVVPMVHDVVLRLPTDLIPGRTYTVTAPEGVVEPAEFVFDPMSSISPAVHVNQNGYGATDELKVGYLADVVPNGGEAGYEPGMAFSVLEDQSGSPVLQGRTTNRPQGDEYGAGDLTGTAVFEADFSNLTEPGQYRLCVDEIGCSEAFDVGDRPWFDLTVAVARAMYHQRSGVAMGPPFTSIERPRPYHPDDGMVIKHSNYRLLDSFSAPLDQVFTRLVEGRTDLVIADAWGGHFDAGDWDRRIQHLYYVRAVVELLEQAPERYASLDLGIPESGDDVPDLLDEGLWTLDLFLRLQGEDGSIRGGIEASEHPQVDNSSWTDNLAVFAYAPDPWSSYLYAGVAAQVADVLAPYEPGRAAVYARSAVAAAQWAALQPPEPGFEAEILGQQAVAAAALFKLTGEQRWHDEFVTASTLDTELDAFLTCNGHTQCDAAWIYATTDPTTTDPEIVARIENSFIATADEIVAAAEQSPFGWTAENQFAPLVWGLGPGGSPGSVGLLRAYQLTEDARYRSAALRSAAVSLGANPGNIVYMTGIGRNPVAHPVIVDVLYGGLPVWPGTPVYGPHRMNQLADDSWIDRFVLEPAGVEPLAADLPYLWQWFDVGHVAVFNEYTVFQSHAEAIYAYGLLAATS